ncbi:type VII secretion protein EccCa [Virgisporangium aurantiacum]|uniref:Type VII secretion protein EccC n=1 Tax=Virgisporangium aurantiacum TaxID=175570 RepID=A0A8J3Z081_9ACTN|nr:type VII secretion protein EccCa [Virgisporangium aurantiacum]GIJ53872.1 type VII secretion protein EccC [Virgisporangium aurantiacum]
MGVVVVRRGARRPAPRLPAGDLVVPPPPAIPEPVGSRWQGALQVLPMLLGTVATALLFAGRSGDRYSLVIGAFFGLSTLGMLATSWGGGGQPRRAELMAMRRDYLRQLAVLRRQVRSTITAQRTAMTYRHPPPEQLWCAADSFRLWERRPGDSDFAVVRVGSGPQTLATPLLAPVTADLDELEPVTAGTLRRFLDAYSVVPDLPVAVSLRGFARVFVRGDGARGLVRAALAQLVTFHAPVDLLVAVCPAPDRRAEWEEVKWLPHAQHPTRVDGAGPVRLVATGVADLEQRLADVIGSRPGHGGVIDGPHVVVVLDGGDPTGAKLLAADRAIAGVTVLDLDTPLPRLLDRYSIGLDTDAGRLVTTTVGDTGDVGVPDTLSRVEAQALMRRLAPRRLPVTGRGEAPERRTTGLTELLGIADAAVFDGPRTQRAARERLRVPIGVGTDGQPVDLDLKESALDGMGPHGLVIGATGSGKSELLRTLVLGLAATHPPANLNFVLIDYKGGATFVSLDRLPHVAAVITNLADELTLVDRMSDAINGEVLRRQELLRRAGNFASIHDYERGGMPLGPLPTLLIVCDEFSELLTAKPDFIDLFVQIGRVGRSLGMHLLLASQRLEEGRLRGLDTHLSYRIGLRTFSALESRAVLGVPDAYELPRTPGHAYLKCVTEPLVRFRAAYASGPYVPPAVAAGSPRRPVLEYTTHDVALPPAGAAPPVPSSDASLLDVLVARLAPLGPPAHRVWLPPLDAPPGLDDLLGPLRVDPARGLTTVNPDLHGALQVPVAHVDKPLEQRRDTLWLPLESSGGHVAVVGSARTGKSTLLRTIVTGLALTHTPAEARVYCLDFGGGTLASVAGLPHVGGVAGRQEITAVRRTVAELVTLLAEREREPLDTAHRAHVFLVVDGWATVRADYDELELTITDLATRGLAYGIHVVVGALRWNDFRPSLRDLFGTRLELRLGEPGDSDVDRRTAAAVPLAPGRGITTDRYHFLAAKPAADLTTAIAAAWTGPPAPRVRLLPELVPYDEIAAITGDPLMLPVGIAEDDLRPVCVDFAAEPHLLLFGDSGCGKTSFLRALAATVVARFKPEQARVILVDYRRGLLGAITGDHLIGTGTGARQATELMETAASYMQRRLPGPDITPDQLRGRSWWSGPELFVLVDDYDLVSTGPTNPLLPLLDFLPQARDIGLHVILTRRSGGASRAMYEQVIQRIRELSGPAVVMSGDRDEGVLVGNVRPGPLPPGRGRLITRRDGVRLVQLAYLPPP